MPAAAAAADRAGTRAELARQMASAGAGSGALVVDLATGQELYASRPDARRTPASVEKLYTSSTALLRLGPDGADPDPGARGRPPRRRTGRSTATSTSAGPATRRSGRRRLTALARELVAGGLTAITGRVRGRRVGVRRAPRAAVVGLRDLGLRRPAERAERRPRDDRAAGAVLPGDPGAVRRAGARPRAAARGRRPGRPGPHGRGARDRAWRSPQTSSPTVGELVARMNVPSDNFYAETLVKLLGARFGDGRHDGGRRARGPLGDDAVRHRPAGGRRLGPLAGQRDLAAPGGRPAHEHRRRPAQRPGAARLAARGRALGHPAHPDARHPGGRQLPGEDRHPDRRLRPRGLLHAARTGPGWPSRSS